jgi:lipopolysaccharide transport system permease protein
MIPLVAPWEWLPRVPRAVWKEAGAIATNLRRSWRVLMALTIIESRRKYAGSVLGMLWYPLYSALLLSCYCFVYLVVFRMRFGGGGRYDYVLFVFSGLIPYIGFSEAISTSMLSVRQSLPTLKNAVFPIEFVPVKLVCAALFGLMSSLAILLLMVSPTGHLGWHLLYLPVAIAMLLLFSTAVAWVVSAVAVVLPDVAQIVNVGLMLLMFVSPVMYPIDIVPQAFRVFVYLNPLTYLVGAFRFAVLGTRGTPLWTDAAFLMGSLVAASLAGGFFRKMSPIFADYE